MVVHGNIARKIQRKPEGIIKLEEFIPGNDLATFLFQLGDRLIEKPHPLIKGPGKTLLLEEQHFRRPLPFLHQFRIYIAHCVCNRTNQLEENRLFKAKELCMSSCPPDDASHHISPAFVRRHQAFRKQECNSPEMISYDPDRNIRFCILPIWHSRHRTYG